MRHSTDPRPQVLAAEARAAQAPDRRGRRFWGQRIAPHARPSAPRHGGEPLAIGLSVLTWVVMAALAWVLLAWLLHWL